MPATGARPPCQVPTFRLDFRNLTPQQGDFVNCLMVGAMAALPCFIQAFINCLGGGTTPGGDDYKPGSRDRCGP